MVEVQTKDQRIFQFHVKDLVEAGYIRDKLRKLAFYDWNSNNVQDLLHVTFAVKYRRALFNDQ